MSIPADIAMVLRDGAAYTLELLGENNVDAPRYEAAIAWLDAQIDAPEPDWNKAPEWVTHHLYDAFGNGCFVNGKDKECDAVSCNAYNSRVWGWVGVRGETYDNSMLPLGIDWRETLRRRPEA